MNEFNEYQDRSLAVMARDLDENTELAVLALGLAGEAGEVADMIKKVLGHGHPLDAWKVIIEIGDVLFYAAVLANRLGYRFSEVADANVDKLARRYPNGFTTEASLTRAT